MGRFETDTTFVVKNTGCAPHLYEQISRCLNEWRWLVPPWVDAFCVVYDGDDPGTIKTNVKEEYRVVYVYVCNGWAKIREDERSRWVMHEILHIHTNHVLETFHDLLESTTNEHDPLRRWATEQARRAVERGTNDLERALWEHVTGV